MPRVDEPRREGARRWHRDRKPSSPLRARILALIAETPGITPTHVRERASVSWATLYHHLAALRDAQQVHMVKEGRRTRLFVAGQQPRHPLPPVLKGTRRRVAETIARLGSAPPALVAKEAGVSRRMAYYHVNRLQEQGLVRREARKGFAPTPQLENILGKGGPGGERHSA